MQPQLYLFDASVERAEALLGRFVASHCGAALGIGYGYGDRGNGIVEERR